ncbi:MAG: 4Fe-4S ferredoxin, partial [Elusimicrobia bacterium]|nr:4Fe-4S ferredoxin [Elusimicrobiota bacterium]
MADAAPPRSLGRSVLLCLPMLVLTGLMLSGGRLPADLPHRVALVLTYAAFNAGFFLMLHTGKTDRWRAALYVSYALLFILSFVSHLVEARGTMLLTEETAYAGGTPFCHIVIPMTLIPAALTKTIIFPGTMTGTYAAIAAMFVIWIGA